jgi:L-threonylcarbamoyladenylate synthase
LAFSLSCGSTTTVHVDSANKAPASNAADTANGAKPAEAPASSGMLASHYAPRAQLRLNADAPQANEAYLAFGARPGTLNLSPTADLHEAARNLFAMLHELDTRSGRIAVAPIPGHGHGEALNDRLRRAAAPRP